MGALGLTGFSVRCAFSAPPYQGPVSDHFDGKRFLNPDPKPMAGGGSMLKWILNREPGHWNDWTEVAPQPPPPERVGAGQLRVTFINHATVLLQLDGLNILTDPIWAERASPFTWMGPRRHKAPGIALDALPPIDVVLVSHNHYDHMDPVSLQTLQTLHHPRTIVTLGNRAFLEPLGIPIAAELDWWQTVDLSPGVRLHCVPAQHFSGRGFCDRSATLWAGFVLESMAGNVYFAADTGWGPHLEDIGQRFGPFRLALLPIGAFRPRWFMSPVHISPEEAIKVHRLVRAAVTVPIHYGTFHLGDDGETEPVEVLHAALAQEPDPKPDFWVLAHGEGREVGMIAPVAS
ncbi:MAG TPA: MBL fold metallo-hydrolase [bacterium]|nr:MBL fold metallo-hydrolase [bacterium]